MNAKAARRWQGTATATESAIHPGNWRKHCINVCILTREKEKSPKGLLGDFENLVDAAFTSRRQTLSCGDSKLTANTYLMQPSFRNAN